MKPNSIVIVNLQSPGERFFGRLIELSIPGITMRGIDLNAFDDWIDHIRRDEENGVRPTTVFFPLHRVEKVILDEGIGEIPSLSETFLSRVGTSVGHHLE